MTKTYEAVPVSELPKERGDYCFIRSSAERTVYEHVYFDPDEDSIIYQAKTFYSHWLRETVDPGEFAEWTAKNGWKPNLPSQEAGWYWHKNQQCRTTADLKEMYKLDKQKTT